MTDIVADVRLMDRLGPIMARDANAAKVGPAERDRRDLLDILAKVAGRLDAVCDSADIWAHDDPAVVLLNRLHSLGLVER